MIEALIGAGASLLGGILGRNSEKNAIARQNAYNDPAQVRARAENAGFNPLLFIGPGVGNQITTGGSNYMGSAIADAGMQIADQMSKNRELARLEKLSAENKKLAEKVQSLTIRPKVGGVYAQRDSTPALRASLGGSDASSNPTDASLVVGDGGSDSGGPVDLRPLPTVDPLDPRRKVEDKPLPSGPGVMKVDNPYLPPLYFPTVDGDEPLDVLDLPSFMLAIPQLAYNFGQYMTYGGGRESGPTITRAEALAREARLKAERDAKKNAFVSKKHPYNPRPMSLGGR